MNTRAWLSLALVLASAALAVAPQAVAASRLRLVQTVSPGESIQEAIDRAAEGGWVFVRPGIYQETGDPTNGLNITRGVHLVGLSTLTKKVVLKRSGSQRNGIVAVPAAHTNCMSCHSSLAPPFPLLRGVKRIASKQPVIYGLSISGITIQDFTNNGLFARNVSGFAIVDVHAVGNKNYGIFPTLSKNGLIANSSASGADDSGIWITTSQNVTATNNLVEGNMVGLEVSNSDDVLLLKNEARGNAVGMAVIFLPDHFADRPDTRRITIRDNHIHDNNKANTATPDSLLSTVPSSLGLVFFGADDSHVTKNVIENHNLSGIAIVDFCLAVSGGPFDCEADTTLPPGFLLDNAPSNNRVVGNILRNNGQNPDPGPFAFVAGDISLLTFDDEGNCFTANKFLTSFSTLGFLPACH